ncbi:MAG: hypothetical protein ACJA0N_002726 [Pseudohongiellaceae bacterium]|jgi:hypothetical protein
MNYGKGICAKTRSVKMITATPYADLTLLEYLEKKHGVSD